MYATCCPLPLFAVSACRVASGGLAIIREPSVQGKLRFSTYTVWHTILPCGAPYQAPPVGKSPPRPLQAMGNPADCTTAKASITMEAIENAATYPGSITLVVVQGEPPGGAGFEGAAPGGLDVVFEQGVGIPAAFGLGNGVVLAVATTKANFNGATGVLGQAICMVIAGVVIWVASPHTSLATS